MLNLPEQRVLLEMTADKLCQHIIDSGVADDLILLSPARAGGLCDVSSRTLTESAIPKVDLLGNGRALRYRLSDLKKHFLSNLVK